MNKKISKQSGFTLMEMIIVILILGALIKVALPNLSIADKGSIMSLAGTLKSIETAKVGYYVDHYTLSGSSFDKLKSEGFLKEGFDPVNVNPFGGELTYTPHTTLRDRVVIEVPNMETADVEKLQTLVSGFIHNESYDADAKIWSVTL